MKYYIVYPHSHEHLGLFTDLYSIPEVECLSVKQKQVDNKIIRFVKQIHTSGTLSKYIHLPFKRVWFEPIHFNIDQNEEYYIVIVDAALRMFSPSYLNSIFSNSNVHGVLVLLNSINAYSVAMYEVKPLISKIKWTDIYTFDPEDAKRYNYKTLNGAYYSKKSEEEIKQYSDEHRSYDDIYFVGGLKGNRKKLVMDIFAELSRNNIKANFNIMVSGGELMHKQENTDKINYYSKTWIPYEKVLAGVLNSNVILEILQDNQNGPSLRYYEAVCYNKKLLTTNKNVVNLPYYDSRYMKIIEKAEDIDFAWVRQRDNVEYNYRGEFSPVNLLEIIRQ